MRLTLYVLILTAICMKCSNINPNMEVKEFTVHKIGQLPGSEFNETNPGVAGAFSGIIKNKLIIAGGANFPDKKPWEGGAKKIYDKIYAFEVINDTVKSIALSVKLPEPLAYGSSVSLTDGVLCIGGNGLKSTSSKVFLIKWDKKANDILISDFPELSVPLCYSTAVLSEDMVYVIGGASTPNGTEIVNYFFSLDLSKRNSPDFGWEKLTCYPGISRTFSVSVAQSNGIRKCIYFFSGRNTNNPVNPVVLNDGLVYDPADKTWKNIPKNTASDFPVMAGSAFPIGTDNIVFAGGVSDSIFLKEQQLKFEMADAINQKNISKTDFLKNELLQFYTDHKGFSQKILIYNTVSNTIISGGNFNTFCPVTTSAIPFNDGAIIASGEIKPGVRTPGIFRISLSH